MFKKIRQFLISPKSIFTINLALVFLGLFFNRLIQGFCNPSLWSFIVIAVSLGFVVIAPFSFVSNSRSKYLGFVAGISFASFLYCILFLAHINLFALPLVLIGIGVIILIPHFFAFQLIRTFFFKAKTKSIRLYFVVGVVFCFLVSAWAGKTYNTAMSKIKIVQESNSLEFEPNLMTEKIIGMHFIYHTKICEYDGWRPPIHEPLLVLGMWWNSMEDPLHISLENRLSMYRTVFPDNPVKYNCSCAITESGNYHKDELWSQ